MKDTGAKEASAIKRALLLVLLGLVVLVFALYEVTPATFLVFAGVAVPLVVAGVAYYVVVVLRVLRQTKGL